MWKYHKTHPTAVVNTQLCAFFMVTTSEAPRVLNIKLNCWCRVLDISLMRMRMNTSWSVLRFDEHSLVYWYIALESRFHEDADRSFCRFVLRVRYCDKLGASKVVYFSVFFFFFLYDSHQRWMGGIERIVVDMRVFLLDTVKSGEPIYFFDKFNMFGDKSKNSIKYLYWFTLFLSNFEFDKSKMSNVVLWNTVEIFLDKN